MNNRHRRVAKLRNQELNVLKTKFESVADASDAIRKFGISILDIKWEDTE